MVGHLSYLNLRKTKNGKQVYIFKFKNQRAVRISTDNCSFSACLLMKNTVKVKKEGVFYAYREEGNKLVE